MSKTDSPSGAPNTFPHVSTDPEADVAPIADEAAHPGKYDDQKGSPEVENSILASSYIGADKYAQKRESFWNVYRSTTFQFLIVGCLAFAGPAQVNSTLFVTGYLDADGTVFHQGDAM